MSDIALGWHGHCRPDHCAARLLTSTSITCFSILTACYKARTRSAPDFNHSPVGRVPVLRPFELYWENPGSDPRYSRGW